MALCCMSFALVGIILHYVCIIWLLSGITCHIIFEFMIKLTPWDFTPKIIMFANPHRLNPHCLTTEPFPTVSYRPFPTDQLFEKREKEQRIRRNSCSRTAVEIQWEFPMPLGYGPQAQGLGPWPRPLGFKSSMPLGLWSWCP